jgi:hypothetical protein
MRTTQDRFLERESDMAFNVSGWGTVGAGQTIAVGYIFGSGSDEGAQVAMGKPEGATLDGSSNGALVSSNQQINLDVASGAISYQFQLQNLTESDTSFMLCGGGLN